MTRDDVGSGEIEGGAARRHRSGEGALRRAGAHVPRRRRRLLALFTVLGIVLAACSNSGDGDTASADGETDTTAGGEAQAISGVPGVTDEAINFALLSTGEANPLGYCLLACYQDGVEAYFAFRNSEGGVHGRELVLSEVVDDELVNNQVKALELAEDPDVFGIFSVPIIATGFADIAAAGVPLYTNVVPATESAGKESILQTTGTPCIACPNPLHIQATLLAGGSRVGVVGYGVSQASKDQVGSVVASIDAWGADAGVELAFSNDEMPFGLPNGVGPEVSAMKDEDVDFVITGFDQNGALTLKQEMERQGMGDVPMVLPQGYADGEFVSQNADLLQGDLLQTYVRPVEADPEGTQMSDFLEWMEEAGAEVTDHALHGWVAADLAYEGLLAAGPQFDRDAVVQASNQLTEYTGGGMVAAVDFSRQHTPPTPDDPVTNGPALRCGSFVQVSGGEFELLGEPGDPWYCFDPAEAGWTEPTQTDFE